MLVFTQFLQCQKKWKARNTVNSGVLATVGRWNAGIFAVFCPWRYQTLVNYNIFCTFWTLFLLWWTPKTLVSTRFSKNWRSWRERNLAQKCCKLQHLVRCLCSILNERCFHMFLAFFNKMLSHVLGILGQETTSQIETRRQCGPKESWREETRR